MSELTITIPIDDWHDEALKTEMPITDKQTIIDLIEAGLHTAKVGRMAITWRELGEAPGDILRPNKVLLESAAQHNISQIVRAQKHEVETKDGKIYYSRDYVGQLSDDEDGYEQSYIHYTSRAAVERALTYLENAVPGHIWNRLITLYENGGDYKEAARSLIMTIDEMVGRLD